MPPDPRFAHRWRLEGRARLNNAADTRYFFNRKALVYHFLDVYNPEEDSNGSLESCTFRCGICGRGNWKWRKNGRSRGSTSNMNGHMKEKHPNIWQPGVQSDKAARIALLAAESQSTVPVKPLHPVSSSKPFDIEVFNEKLTRWFVKRNKPAAEMENEAFRELLLFLKPTLEGQLLDSTGMGKRVEAMKQSKEN
ncbi:unnamed protein product [Rhizoctonia solani]|uniref:BED-type domain-containing protein n=1 Tax=Rhizoctonia solani TaxID=456999 RepID=A0A8H3HGW6_9AGAM|nr:unnamed protein product [Rhizoctonia solani]